MVKECRGYSQRVEARISAVVRDVFKGSVGPPRLAGRAVSRESVDPVSKLVSRDSATSASAGTSGRTGAGVVISAGTGVSAGTNERTGAGAGTGARANAGTGRERCGLVVLF